MVSVEVTRPGLQHAPSVCAGQLWPYVSPGAFFRLFPYELVFICRKTHRNTKATT